MKKQIIILLMIFIPIIAFSQTNYYWYKGEKIPLIEKNSRRYVLTQLQSVSQLESIFKQQNIKYDSFKTMVYTGSNTMGVGTQSLSWSFVEGNNISTVTTNNTMVLYEAPFYIMDGRELGLSQIFYVKLKNESGVQDLINLASQHNVQILGENQFMPLWFTLTCTKASTGNALEMANIFYETNKFSASEPDLIDNIHHTCDNDPLFGSQWALRNSGQNGGTLGIDTKYCDVKSITRGSSNITVAVFDEGIDLGHPDINLSTLSYDTKTGTSPSVLRGDHGTACAGIISAKSNNNLGVAGIASESKGMSISFMFGSNPNSAQEIANGINYATNNGASVISNSWGGGANSTLIDDAFTNALTKGRNGKGCVVVFSAGNSNSASTRYPANSNLDFLVVGAMSPCGQRKNTSSCDNEYWWGSNYGTYLDIVAPGVLIPTTDIRGSAGYTSGDYTMNFNGTSAACPHAAAVAALVLSVNPNLTQKEVVNIIESSAQKVGSYTYSTTPRRTNGTWNFEMGYGLLDAYAAVMKAQICTTTDFSNKTVSSAMLVVCNNITSSNITVSNGATLVFEGKESIVINSLFTVNAGSTLELKNK